MNNIARLVFKQYQVRFGTDTNYTNDKKEDLVNADRLEAINHMRSVDDTGLELIANDLKIPLNNLKCFLDVFSKLNNH
jgi:hypothetical protein